MATTITASYTADKQSALILDLIQRKCGAMYLFRPLSRAEHEAWRRWHRDMTTGEMLHIRRGTGVFPLIRGGAA